MRSFSSAVFGTLFGLVSIVYQAQAAQRGLAWGTDNTLAPVFANSSISWYHHWQLPAVSQMPSNISYVPMDWGPLYAKRWATRSAAFADNLPAYILAYNEPDVVSQANMTPLAAAEDFVENLEPWRQKGVLVSSPQIVWNITWMDDFLVELRSRGSDVDFMAIHSYGPWNDTTTPKTYIKNVHTRYGLDVWITEMGTTLASNGTQLQTQTYMNTMMNWADTQSYINRTVWTGAFELSSPPDEYISNLDAMLYDDGTLTPLGRDFIQIPQLATTTTSTTSATSTSTSASSTSTSSSSSSTSTSLSTSTTSSSTSSKATSTSSSTTTAAPTTTTKATSTTSTSSTPTSTSTTSTKTSSTSSSTTPTSTSTKASTSSTAKSSSTSTSSSSKSTSSSKTTLASTTTKAASTTSTKQTATKAASTLKTSSSTKAASTTSSSKKKTTTSSSTKHTTTSSSTKHKTTSTSTKHKTTSTSTKHKTTSTSTKHKSTSTSSTKHSTSTTKKATTSSTSKTSTATAKATDVTTCKRNVPVNKGNIARQAIRDAIEEAQGSK